MKKMENLNKIDELATQLKNLYEVESKLLNSSDQISLMFEITCEYLKDGILTPKPYKSFKDYFYFEFFEGESYASISKHPQKSNIYNKLNCWQYFVKGVNKELASDAGWVASKVEEIKSMSIKEILGLVNSKKESEKAKKGAKNEAKNEAKNNDDDVERVSTIDPQVTPEKVILNFENLNIVLNGLLNNFERLNNQNRGLLLEIFDDFIQDFNYLYKTSYQNSEATKDESKVNQKSKKVA